MATKIIAETIRSTRGKDKLIINGFIYKMNKSTSELQHWVCEKRRHCKARVTTNANLVIMKLNPEQGRASLSFPSQVKPTLLPMSYIFSQVIIYFEKTLVKKFHY